MLDLYALDPMGIGRRLPAAVKKRLPEGLIKSKAVVFLAYVGKSPAGVAICFERYSTFSASPIFNIHDFAVSPKYRGKGIAQAMFQKIVEHSLQKKYKRITLEVRKDNIPARQLYQKQGVAPGNPPYEYWVRELP
jgi:ribosomal protein S18 acetylase RimI-like enzyme